MKDMKEKNKKEIEEKSKEIKEKRTEIINPIKTTMENIYKFEIPLKVNYSISNSLNFEK